MFVYACSRQRTFFAFATNGQAFSIIYYPVVRIFHLWRLSFGDDGRHHLYALLFKVPAAAQKHVHLFACALVTMELPTPPESPMKGQNNFQLTANVISSSKPM